ncbi:hypothetical protein [Aquabacterium sp. NJ1]|uniref:hypothetical protein n=1 Tax=Aquabacterium sp. NJ1 TaxID=1538295 RepID=UPI001269FBDF|nr:hypothetical protein [Aquabacterium sp. NJ1]
MTSRFKANPQRVYAGSVGIWGTLVCCHAAWYIHAALSTPLGTDVYADSWQFQAMAFALFKLPYWLMFIVTVLLAEFFVFGRKAKQA